MEMNAALAKIQAFYEKKRRMPTVREVMTLIRTRSMKQATALIERLVESGRVESDIVFCYYFLFPIYRKGLL